MLDDTYKLCLESAKHISNWDKVSKSELVNKYIEYEETDRELASDYMAAIICRYWPKIQRFHRTMYFSSSYEDVYDILINSILRAIKARRWLDKDSSIYNDPNGPDKVINRTMICERLNLLAYKNRSKRVADLNPLSTEELEDGSGDYYAYNNENASFSIDNELEITSNLKFLYNKKLYLAMFVYYSIAFNLGTFKDKMFSSKFCAIALLNLTDEDFIEIASLINKDVDEIKKDYSIAVLSKNRTDLKLNIEYAILKLKELYIKETI